MRSLFSVVFLLAVLAGTSFQVVSAEDPLDAVHNVALPCEAVSTPGLMPRSARNLAHVANVCGFVGTDIEFQSRTAADGTVHDYAFLGTMGGGTRIFDVTDPAHPVAAGRYTDPGYQNDVAVRGDLLVLAFDQLGGNGGTSTCLHQKSDASTSAQRGGIDIVRLVYNAQTATFTTALIDCYLSAQSAGSHTVTIHPSGNWISVNTASGDGLEVVDMRTGVPQLARIVGSSIVASAHDVSFSRDGNTLYSAGLGSTRIVDVSTVLSAPPTRLATLSNNPDGAPSNDPRAIQLSHQSDVSSDGAILVVTDEAGGGTSQTSCNEGPSGKIGAAHFWNIANVAAPTKLGLWLYPNPGLIVDALEPSLAAIGRSERACTIHVLRNGGNGSAGPGAIAAGFDGVSRLPSRQFVTAHYGAGTWWVDFSGPSRSDDGIAEDPRSTWGNTLGWNVMPGADTWSSKEYKGFIYTGDMTRGMDVFSFTSCVDAGCVLRPTNTPGSAAGGGKLPNELAEFLILRGSTAGGEAQFGMDVRYVLGGATPVGSLSFKDKGADLKVESTAIDSFTVVGSRATFTGRATVDGVPGVSFFVEVEDLGKAGADTFRIVLGNGYAAAGVLTKGNITVSGGLL